MTRISLSDALFPKIRQRIIGLLFSHPERWTYQGEVARDLGVSQSSLQLELKRLIDAEILESEARGNRLYFRPDKNCIIYDELAGIALKTEGLVEEVRRFLRPFDNKIASAFIYGSIARGKENSSSDVDLMLIGKLTLREISPALRALESKVNREVSPHMMTTEEAREMLLSPNHFLSTVIGAPKIILVRNDVELTGLFEKEPAEHAFHKQSGNK